ncbi:NADH:flavin oxidoreductase/NADH oxidase [Deinococcus detaillensis]|uniref:NADH:flavin oxidoreductase/NADH oxidase n=1 Tax=Deinococcus detaillensis TaxID=2592048 RepID=A0A553UWC5_9DEIO|nr:NADH:flavin oxidoreductase/NADH oxidase [Deinococcus detaillensis]TSA84510.1 NADH:flavin oxidoreductase/NADH oxidase [Deinococcus detaillensis]
MTSSSAEGFTLSGDGSSSPVLLSPLRIAQLTLKNRVVVSPMCMYSAEDGFANDFHLVHLGRFALGGAALIFTEAAAVSPEGRISPDDLGLWNDQQIGSLARIADFVHQQGALIGIQLAHAGRKAGMSAPWKGGELVPPEAGGWTVLGPDVHAYSPRYGSPHAMSPEDIAQVVKDFTASARRAVIAGFDTLEIHAAHGYLLHQFLSPLSNSRLDQYGGTLENRARLLLEVTRAVRGVWPDHLPLFVRLSATDWAPGGWDIEQTVEISRQLSREGVNVIDVSSGGLTPDQQITAGPGYQVPFAERLKQDTDLVVMAVGMITEPQQAEQILQAKQADLVALARELLRDPQFVQRTAWQSGQAVEVPVQYQRAWPKPE